MLSKAHYSDTTKLKEKINVAKGAVKADLVLKNVNFLDVYSGEFVTGDVAIHDDLIVGVLDSYEGKSEIDATGRYLVPGFIDSHVHIESSLMTPARFQETVLPLGTTSAIWDPHEIANVKGVEGIEWAIESSEGLDIDIFVMVPSCVPSTTPSFGLESSGALLTYDKLRKFRDHPRVLGLAEMMNFPGLLMGDDDITQKLVDFSEMKRDGHCPSLSGKDLNAYGVAGIFSCHESTTIAEAKEKLTKGIHVLIREGSCAKNAESLLPLLNSYTSCAVSLCSDDRNPLDIEKEGHINFVVDLALREGHAPQDIFRAASYATATSYGMEDRGVIAPGYKADLVLLSPKEKDWKNGMEIHEVYKSGSKVDSSSLGVIADNDSQGFDGINMHLDKVTQSDFVVPSEKPEQKIRVIEAIPNQILTNEISATLAVKDGNVKADPTQDILKIAVLERHNKTNLKTCAFVKGFNLKSGAIATSINHDSHNVIVVGADEESMALAVNHLLDIDGGIVVQKDGDNVVDLPLPLGGLMTNARPEVVSGSLAKLKSLAKDLGCDLYEPFLQLSFLALPVIPSLKITDKGLVDVNQFKIVPTLLD